MTEHVFCEIYMYVNCVNFSTAGFQLLMSYVLHHFLWKLILVSLNVTVFAEKIFDKIYHVLTLDMSG